MSGQVDAHMNGKAKIASYSRLIRFLRDDLGLTPSVYKDYSRNRETGNLFLLRHDVDHSLGNAEMLAAVENELGVHSTYFMLHPGDYNSQENYYGRIEGGRIVHQPDFFERCRKLQNFGHEIAIHTDFFQLSYLTRRPVRELLEEELAAFEKAGVKIFGTASHGSSFIRSVSATNYEMFSDCRRADIEPRELVKDDWSAMTHAFSMADVGLEYEAYYLPRNLDLTDTGAGFTVINSSARHDMVDLLREEDYGVIRDMANALPSVRMPVLIHPCWWLPGNAEGQLISGSPAKTDFEAGKTVASTKAAAPAPAAPVTGGLDEIRAGSSARTFPVAAMVGATTGVAFFCAAFMGKNDVIHVHDAGVRELWLNDIDREKLEEMGRLYGASKRLLPGDSFAVSRELALAGRTFDVVVLDPFTSLMQRAMLNEVRPFLDITGKVLVGGMCKGVLDDLGVKLLLRRSMRVTAHWACPILWLPNWSCATLTTWAGFTGSCSRGLAALHPEPAGFRGFAGR